MDERCDVHGGGELGASAACVLRMSTDSGDQDLLRSPIDFCFRMFLGHRDRGHGFLRAAGHRKLAGSDFKNWPCTCLVPRLSPRLSSHIPALSVSIVAHTSGKIETYFMSLSYLGNLVDLIKLNKVDSEGDLLNLS
jgi:hypothetical protein